MSAAAAAAAGAIAACQHKDVLVIPVAMAKPPSIMPPPSYRHCNQCGAFWVKGKWTRAPLVEQLVTAAAPAAAAAK